MSATLVRPPAVAGTFYAADARQLAADVDALLAAAPARGPMPKALVVPHAGYVYSGPIAANGYARLRDGAAQIRRVVLLGPAHRVPVRSMAVPSAAGFSTPLGAVPIDNALRAEVLACSGVVCDDAPHRDEHSLEVHLPFLQRILGNGWAMLPIVVGGAAEREVAAVLQKLWGGDDTLLVVSSDLSHYENYEQAARHDRLTAERIVRADSTGIDPHDACGAHPLRGLLREAQRRHLHIEELDVRSSGDTAGDRSRVVGYGAFALYDSAPEDSPNHVAGGDAATAAGSLEVEVPHLNAAEAAMLLDAATSALAEHLGQRASDEGARSERAATGESRLGEFGASFVTLRSRTGTLLGCIGSLEPKRPLLEDVRANTVAAAARDPRFAPVRAQDLRGGELHLSVLSALQPLTARDRQTLSAALRPGVDGILIESGTHRATFLPAVWEQLPDTDVFLEHLWAKAGLAPGSWPSDLRAWRYRAEEFSRSLPR